MIDVGDSGAMKWVSMWGFLVVPYRPECSQYELWSVLKRAGIAIVIQALSYGYVSCGTIRVRFLPLFCAFAFVTIDLIYQVYARPYRTACVNRLSTTWTMFCLLCLFSAMVFSAPLETVETGLFELILLGGVAWAIFMTLITLHKENVGIGMMFKLEKKLGAPGWEILKRQKILVRLQFQRSHAIVWRNFAYQDVPERLTFFEAMKSHEKSEELVSQLGGVANHEERVWDDEDPMEKFVMTEMASMMSSPQDDQKEEDAKFEVKSEFPSDDGDHKGVQFSSQNPGSTQISAGISKI